MDLQYIRIKKGEETNRKVLWFCNRCFPTKRAKKKQIVEKILTGWQNNVLRRDFNFVSTLFVQIVGHNILRKHTHTHTDLKHSKWYPILQFLHSLFNAIAPALYLFFTLWWSLLSLFIPHSANVRPFLCAMCPLIYVHVFLRYLSNIKYPVLFYNKYLVKFAINVGVLRPNATASYYPCAQKHTHRHKHIHSGDE